MTPRADTHSRVERARHSRVVGMCWSMVLVSVENLLRMLPSGVVSNSLEAGELCQPLPALVSLCFTFVSSPLY